MFDKTHPTIPGDRVVAAAKEWMGTPYHHQAAKKGAGTDCLGFIRGLWEELNGFTPEHPPAYSPSWGEYGKEELMLEAAKRNLVMKDEALYGLTLPPARRLWAPGDILLFRHKINMVAKHCAVVSGSGTMVHAYSGVGVTETGIGIWETRVAGIFAFPSL
jgi:NlpC/P60 family putative phage cell wall peptidase